TISAIICGMLLLTGVLTACGDKSGSQPGAQSPATGGRAEASDGNASIVDDVSQMNVVRVAAGSKDHTTLVAAVKAADLTDVLASTGPFTVFAPTNAAFDLL